MTLLDILQQKAHPVDPKAGTTYRYWDKTGRPLHSKNIDYGKKHCAVCARERKLSMFHPDTRSEDGRTDTCKHCVSEIRKTRAADLRAKALS